MKRKYGAWVAVQPKRQLLGLGSKGIRIVNKSPHIIIAAIFAIGLFSSCTSTRVLKSRTNDWEREAKNATAYIHLKNGKVCHCEVKSVTEDSIRAGSRSFSKDEVLYMELEEFDGNKTIVMLGGLAIICGLVLSVAVFYILTALPPLGS